MALDIVSTVKVGRYKITLRERNGEDQKPEIKFGISVERIVESGIPAKSDSFVFASAEGPTKEEAIHKLKLALVEEVKAINAVLELC